MKKNIIIVIVILAIIVLIAGAIVLSKTVTKNNLQGSNENIADIDKSNEMNDNNQNSNNYENTSSNNKILIAVFSRAGENYAVGNIKVGNTEVMANYIKDYTGGDLFIIEPVTPYPNSYDETKKISTRERDNNERPEIKNKVQNFYEYDTIFLGYPIWYGSYPMIINTFLESYDFSEKTIIPFNTHEGSGSSGTYEAIKRKMSNSTIKDGLAIKGSEIRDSKTQVENWLKGLGLVL